MKSLTLSVVLLTGLTTSMGVSTPAPQATNAYFPPSNVSGQPNFDFDTLYKFVTEFNTAFLYPNNRVQALEINSTFFAPNVKGRVDITRNFDGQELSTEYVFGLFSGLLNDTGTFTFFPPPTTSQMVHFTANQNIASLAVLVLFDTPMGSFWQEIDLWLAFNSIGQVEEYDVTFRRFDWALNYLLDAATVFVQTSSRNATVAELTALISKSICVVAGNYCHGPNQQYSDYDECYNYLTTEVRFGQSWELGLNTILCRMIHQVLVKFNPELHCPHIGPSGGGYCVDDRSYNDVVLEPHFTLAPFIPYGYASTNATIAAM